MRRQTKKLADLRDALRRMKRCVARAAVVIASSGLLAYAQVFLGRQLTDKLAPFHYQLCRELDRAMLGGARLIGALPREHAKTTFGTVALVLRELGRAAVSGRQSEGAQGRAPSHPDTGARATKKNILIVGANLREAQGKLRQIVSELESNSLLRLAYGKQCAPARDKQGRIVAYADGEIVLAGGARVSCIGFGGKVRGQLERGRRLDLIVLDDPEDDQSTASPARRERLRRWVFSALLNALDLKTGSLVWLGTLLHHDAVLAQTLAQHEQQGQGPRAGGQGAEAAGRAARPGSHPSSGGGFSRRANTQSATEVAATGGESHKSATEVAVTGQDDDTAKNTQSATEAAATGSRKWRTLRLAALNDAGEPLWPGRWTRERLLARRAEIGARAFAQEYLNQPQSLSEQLFFDERWAVYDPGQLGLCEGRWEYGGRPLAVAIGVDPAIGLQRTNDYFAAVVVGVLGVAADAVAASYSSLSSDATDNRSASYSSPLQSPVQALVLEVRRFRRPFPQQLDCLHELAQRWLPQVIGIESVAYQAALKQAAFEQGLPVQELKGAQAKAARIEALAAQAGRGALALPVHGPWVARLREEAAQYPSGKHDDQLDALAYALECGLTLISPGGLWVYASERVEERGL